jgi:hypothetical protein
MLRPVPNAPLLLPDASRRLALPGASLLQRARARARLGRTYLAADGASCPRRCSCAPNTPRASARAPLGAALDLANEAAARRSSCWHAWARRGRAHACEFAHSHLFCPGHNGPARYARARRNQQCSTPPHSSAPSALVRGASVTSLRHSVVKFGWAERELGLRESVYLRAHC